MSNKMNVKGKVSETITEEIDKRWTQEAIERHEFKKLRTERINREARDNDEESVVLVVDFKNKSRILSSHTLADMSDFEPQPVLKELSSNSSKGRKKKCKQAA